MNPKTRLKMLDARSRESVVAGHDPISKVHKFLVSKLKKFIISRYVEFDELISTH